MAKVDEKVTKEYTIVLDAEEFDALLEWMGKSSGSVLYNVYKAMLAASRVDK